MDDRPETPFLVSSPLDQQHDYQAIRKALLKSEERFQLFSRAVSDAVYRMNADWSQMLSMDGTEFLDPTDEPRQNWITQYIPEEDRNLVQDVINKAIKAKSTFELEHRVIRADGTIGWTLSRAIPVLDEQGGILEWFGAATDVTRRKESEEALHKLEKRTRIAVEAAEMATWEWHLPTNKVYWNEQHFRLLGMKVQDRPVSPDAFLYHVHPDDRPRVTSV